MTQARFRLGIDFGTSTTIAVLQRPDERVQQLLFDGSPLLPSAVLLGLDGRLHTGRDAAHLARSLPERLEPNPKRRIDETGVLLGREEVAVRDLIAAVLGRVAAEAARVAGAVPGATLTHPANWGTGRRALLVDAARLAGFADVGLVPEPVAAATYLAATQDVPVGAVVAVYDLGAGTCDLTLLRRGPGGFAAVASGGLNDLGGLDVDAAVVAFLTATYGPLWTDADSRRRLWDDVRSAKEMLSRASHTLVMVPSLGREVPLGREQLEGLMRPVLRPSVAMTRALLADADVRPAQLAGLFLVGGSSRIPLVATMLHEALGIAPVVAEQPELVVAEGALRHDAAPGFAPVSAPVSAAFTAAVPVSAPTPSPVSAPPFAASPVSPAVPPASAPAGGPVPRGAVPLDAGRRRSRKRLLAAGAAVVVLAGVLAVVSPLLYDPDDGAEGPGGQPSASATRYNLTKVPDDLCAAIDLQPFADLYEREAEPPIPARNVMAAAGSASCNAVRLHDSGAVRATFSAEVRVSPQESTADFDFEQRIGGDAALNDGAVQLTGLGDEAVVFEYKGATAQAKTMMTLMVGVRDGNLIWQLRLTVDRRDKAGWTAAQKQDLRDRLVAVTRSALPQVTAAAR
jgi:actin-like ATPase involved in cell morphogenesis